MNKEEILSKSRQSNKDEGLEYIENKGRKIGYSIFTCVFAFIVIFNTFIGQKSDAVSALFWTFGLAENIAKYQFTHEKKNLILAIGFLITTIFSLTNFVLSSLR
ncbi:MULTISPECIES: DUF6442 family protein [Clostridioides]|uniref:DUF6442 family protein n=1 Tax=Clostridioides sp. ZZV14-6387 TaxID=2811497 RepID=UPI0006BBB769|nr:hypothetical protein KW95_01900 [Clostridioides difficile]MCC0693598.1 hypothetical protein [Clostridioides sp. ZZV14-6387]MDB3085833.1 hypothetical protein [Clostridioides difficile]MDI0267006.1 DUF6442 family protein [Clostridioides difficile]MDI7818336.1 DUF6442 family protein [Clostridioides difficile]